MFRSLFIPLRKNTTLGALSLLSLRENYCSDLWIKNCQYHFGARLSWAFKKIIVQTFGMNCHFEALSLLGSRDDYCPHLWEDLQLWACLLRVSTKTTCTVTSTTILEHCLFTKITDSNLWGVWNGYGNSTVQITSWVQRFKHYTHLWSKTHQFKDSGC